MHMFASSKIRWIATGLKSVYLLWSGIKWVCNLAYIWLNQWLTPSCDIVFHTSCTCWCNTARDIGGLNEWVKHSSIMPYICSTGLAIVPARNIVEYHAKHVELYGYCVGVHYSVGITDYFPVAEMATE